MIYSKEDFNILYEVLDLVETDPKCDQSAVEHVNKSIKKLQELNGTLEAECVMESIRYKMFMLFNIVV